MIKLIAIDPPSELTPELVKKLTEEFKIDSKKPVWRQDYIQAKLLEMSHRKCCYCECEINVAGSDLHIEHFYPKHLYKEDVVNWENLLPACKRCNTKKGKVDPKDHPIIHPIKNDPKDHLKVNQFYLYSKDELGEFTIDKLDLNDADRLAVDRYKLGFEIIKKLDMLFKEVNNLSIFNEKNTTKFCRELEGIMKYGTASKKYSAVISTTILTNDDYKKIEALFKNNSLWNKELEKLEKEMKYCALL